MKIKGSAILIGLSTILILTVIVLALKAPHAQRVSSQSHPDIELAVGALIFCAAIVSAVVIYFTPTIVAVRRGKANVAPIIIVNIFFGWTLVGWVVALAWAVSTQAIDLQNR